MKSRLLTFLFFFGAMSAEVQAQTLPERITIQPPLVNIHATQNVRSEVLIKLKQLNEVTLLEKGDSAKIDGVTDFWYKVTFEDKTGYVFGHLTSLRRAGRRKVIKQFTTCDMGDRYHLVFEDMDFGQARNELGKYEFCREDTNSGLYKINARYKGRQFELILNYLYTRVPCGEESSEVCIKPMDTIVGIRILETN